MDIFYTEGIKMKRTCNGCRALGLDATDMSSAVCMLGKSITDDERGARPAEECDKPKTLKAFATLMEAKQEADKEKDTSWESYEIPEEYKREPAKPPTKSWE